ncbi:MFS general substrate transporter [Meredithblackwellia eburnea MCA 4105]
MNNPAPPTKLPRLTAEALDSLTKSSESETNLKLARRGRPSSPDRLTLSGDTPVPTAPPSISGDTEVDLEEDPSANDLKQKKFIDLESATCCTPQPEIASSDFPEGGLQAYTAVAGAFLVMMSTFALSNSFGCFLQEYQRNQLSDYPASTITWIGSVHIFLVFGTSLISGIGFDRGYFRIQLAFGSSLWVFGIFMLSLSKTFIQIFLSQAICLGLGLGIMFTPVLSCVGSYFHRKRALMIGICASGGAVGAIFLPILLNTFFESHGFAASVRIAAYIMTATLLLVNLTMRPRSLPTKSTPPFVPLVAKMAREPSTWLTCFGIFGGVVGLFVVMFYVQVFVRSHGASPVLGKYSLAILNSAAFFGRLIVGVTADHFGMFNTAVPYVFAMSLSIFALLGATTTGGTLTFLLIFGFTSGSFISLMASCFMALADDVSEIGVRLGLGWIFVAVAGLLGSPVAGAILGASVGSYVEPVCFAGGMGLVGAVLLVLARRSLVGKKGTGRV